MHATIRSVPSSTSIPRQRCGTVPGTTEDSADTALRAGTGMCFTISMVNSRLYRVSFQIMPIKSCQTDSQMNY